MPVIEYLETSKSVDEHFKMAFTVPEHCNIKSSWARADEEKSRRWRLEHAKVKIPMRTPCRMMCLKLISLPPLTHLSFLTQSIVGFIRPSCALHESDGSMKERNSMREITFMRERNSTRERERNSMRERERERDREELHERERERER